MSKPLILFYEPSPTPWGGKLKQYCALQGIRLRPVGPAELGRTVGSLAGGTASAEESISAGLVPEPMLVLCSLSTSHLDRLLSALRGMEAGGCLKAVLTQSNSGWTLAALYRELCRERLAMGGIH